MPVPTTAASMRGTRGTGVKLAQAACVVGLLFAAVSAYWGVRGTWLLDTLPASFEKQARAHEFGIFAAVWAAVVLKIMAAVLPVLALRRSRSAMRSRVQWALAWSAAIVLTLYGLAQTAAAQLTYAGVVDAAPSADDRRLVWRAFVWDPWFLIWGLLAVAALLYARRHRDLTPAHA
jgi:uncharacterized membrane protein